MASILAAAQYAAKQTKRSKRVSIVFRLFFIVVLVQLRRRRQAKVKRGSCPDGVNLWFIIPFSAVLLTALKVKEPLDSELFTGRRNETWFDLSGLVDAAIPSTVAPKRSITDQGIQVTTLFNGSFVTSSSSSSSSSSCVVLQVVCCYCEVNLGAEFPIHV